MTARRPGKRPQYELNDVEREVLVLVQMLDRGGQAPDAMVLSACSPHSQELIEAAIQRLLAMGLLRWQDASPAA